MKSIKLSKKILRAAGRANAKYRLIEEGDRVLVGLSGGKDSITLVHLLKHMQRHAPFSFEFKAVTVHYGMPGERYDLLKEHCEIYGIPLEIYETNIYEISQETIRENSSFCSYFSRMRRGALYTKAQEGGYNKVALGHHLDDAAESFFMNMLYNGTLRSMAPIYRSSKGFHVIRPLLWIRERQTAAFAEENGIATIGDEACPAMRMRVKMPHARESTKKMLEEWERSFPDLFKRFKAAFCHIQPDSFMDERYLER
ncbi:ATP-binding protein [Hydrogenimonas urashimensis]|uniref:ATP-binding protein n=1 Tax=Hydrogenimonas urashimensis TaxID=2740515 RepID=UPI0019164BC0|nr:ATP-binding protein [Hydrogenimonas urashimensis]